MSNQVTKVTEKRLEVLHHLKTHEGEIVNLTKLAELRNNGEPTKSDKEATRRLVKRMDESGLVNYESSYSGSKVSLTTTGLKEIQNNPYPHGNVGGNVGGDDLKRLHGFVVTARIMSDTPSDWVGVLQERDEVSVLKDGENDSILARDKWVIRLHKDSITFQLRDGCSISSSDSADVFRRAYSQVKNVGGWLEGACGIKVQLKRFKIKNAELGFEGHPLAELAGSLPGVPLDRFSVEDPDLQKEALGIDASPGTEELEPKSERAESIAQSIEMEMEQYVKRPEAIEKRHNLENELMVQNVSAQETVHAVRNMSKTKEVIERVEEKLTGMNEFQNEQKKTRDALIELVRSNQNVIHELKEQLGSEEEQVQDGSGIRNGLADHVEVSSKWIDCHGNLMAYSPELGKQFKLIDSEDL